MEQRHIRTLHLDTATAQKIAKGFAPLVEAGPLRNLANSGRFSAQTKLEALSNIYAVCADILRDALGREIP